MGCALDGLFLELLLMFDNCRLIQSLNSCSTNHATTFLRKKYPNLFIVVYSLCS